MNGYIEGILFCRECSYASNVNFSNSPTIGPKNVLNSRRIFFRVEGGVTIHKMIPVMDYQQYRRMRKLVHECCNYNNGNCIALDNGEECYVWINSAFYEQIDNCPKKGHKKIPPNFKTKPRGK